MKNLVFPIVFWFIFSSAGLTQNQVCDTLYLTNGTALPLYIDSMVNKRIYGRSCDDMDNRKLVFNAGELVSVKLKNGLIISDFAMDPKESQFQMTTHSADQEGWVFSKKSKKRKVIIPKKNQIAVRYLTASGNKTSYGRLISLNGRELTLETKRKGVLSIPIETISSIKKQKRIGWLGTVLGGLGMVTMVLLVIGFIIASIVIASISLTISVLTAGGNSSDPGPGCSPAILLLLIGSITAIVLSLPTTIKEPFSGEWEISGPPLEYFEGRTLDQP
jgi:hypothetical protein